VITKKNLLDQDVHKITTYGDLISISIGRNNISHTYAATFDISYKTTIKEIFKGFYIFTDKT